MSGFIAGSAIVLCQGSQLALSMLIPLVTTLLAGRLWGIMSAIVHGCVFAAVVASAGWEWKRFPIPANLHELGTLVLLVLSVAWLGAIGRRARRLRATSIHL